MSLMSLTCKSALGRSRCSLMSMMWSHWKHSHILQVSPTAVFSQRQQWMSIKLAKRWSTRGYRSSLNQRLIFPKTKILFSFFVCRFNKSLPFISLLACHLYEMIWFKPLNKWDYIFLRRVQLWWQGDRWQRQTFAALTSVHRLQSGADWAGLLPVVWGRSVLRSSSWSLSGVVKALVNYQ